MTRSIRLPAFTLVELLVVITIIVVLLALLSPAMDRAVYQAELAVCGARQRAVGSGVLTYAAANNRSFSIARFVQPDLIANQADKRPALRTMLGVALNGLLNCPLTGKVGIDESQATSTYASYYLWFGWWYDGQRRMARIGDRFTWNGYGYSVIASDINIMWDTQARSNHPDRDPAKMWGLVLDQGDDPWRDGDSTMTISTWRLTGTPERGLLDNNFAYQDGSVRRVDAIAWNGDSRLREVPNFSDGTAPSGIRAYLPAE